MLVGIMELSNVIYWFMFGFFWYIVWRDNFIIVNNKEKKND